MSTPTDQHAQKEPKPKGPTGKTPPKGAMSAPKQAPAAPQAKRLPQPTSKKVSQQSQAKPAASAGPSARVTPQAPAKAVAPTPPKPTEAVKSTTPAAPKPRDPGAIQRDERREERRAQIQARQQERRQELQQVKRQKLSIRYSIPVAAVLLVGLVSFFSVEHQFLGAVISAAAVLFCLVVFVAVMSFMPARTSGRSRPRLALPAEAARETASSAAPADSSPQADEPPAPPEVE